MTEQSQPTPPIPTPGPATETPKKKGPGCGTFIAIGCGSIALILLVGGVILALNFKKIAPALASKATIVAAEAGLNQLGIPDSEREKAMVPIRELADKIRSKEITGEQFGAIMDSLFEGSLPAVIMIRVAEVNYLEPSKLPDEEKATGRLSLHRFARGITEEKIPQTEVDRIMDIVTYKQSGAGEHANTKFKERLTKEELRECLAIMKQSADRAQIPNEEFPINIAREIEQAIKKGLAKQE